MKRHIRYIVVFLLLALLVNGCGRKSGIIPLGDNSSEESSMEESADESREEHQEEESSSEPEPEPEPEPIPEPVSIGDGLWNLDAVLNPKADKLIDVYFVDNDAVLLIGQTPSGSYSYQLKQLSDGTLIAQMIYDQLWEDIRIDKEGIQGEIGRQQIYCSKTGFETMKRPKKTKACYRAATGWVILKNNSVRWKEQEAELPKDQEEYQLVGIDDQGTILVQAWSEDKHEVVYYTVNGEGVIRELNMGYVKAEQFRDWYVQRKGRSLSMFQLDNTRRKIEFVLEPDEALMDAAGTTVLNGVENGTIRMYDIVTGDLLQRVESPCGRATLNPEGSQGIVLTDAGQLLLFEAMASPEKVDSEYGWNTLPSTELSAQEYADEMAERYGIEIHIGEDAIYPFQDFVCRTLYDESEIQGTLEKVDELLGSFPEGFLQELMSGELKHMRIYIVGEIIGAQENGATSTPIAFTYPNYGLDAEFVILDGRYPEQITTNLAHELMHFVTTYIENETPYGFEYWADYLPEGFHYNYGYQDADGWDYSDWTYTTWDYEGNPIYFIDDYSKTWETEDRSRLFEYLMMAGLGLGDMSRYEGTPLMDRAAYMCEVIRETFTCINDNTECIWERPLNQ